MIISQPTVSLPQKHVLPTVIPWVDISGTIKFVKIVKQLLVDAILISLVMLVQLIKEFTIMIVWIVSLPLDNHKDKNHKHAALPHMEPIH